MTAGFANVVEQAEPSRVLPADLSQLIGRQVALKFTGGIGDCIIAIGGLAPALEKAGALVTAVTLPHQGPLLLRMQGVSAWIAAQRFNSPVIRGKFDLIFDFAFTFNRAHELKEGEYYSLASARAGVLVVPGQFDFKHTHDPKGRVVALHPGASNPNRRWSEDKWRELAFEIRDRGFDVLWLGTRDEYGFNAKGITKLSDADPSLVGQAKKLAESDYFIGCDSGFAHIAGVLGVPGLVIFLNTHPKDVIESYPSLKGVHCFERLTLQPSRSLVPNCWKTNVLRECLGVEEVLNASSFGAIGCTPGIRDEEPSMKASIALVGVPDKELQRLLSEIFDVTVMTNMPTTGTEFDAVLEIRENLGRLYTKHSKVMLSLENFENVRRAIRENLNR